MPEIMGIKDWHCVTRGQIRDTEWRPLLPLGEMGFVVGTKRITREREHEGGEEMSADRSSLIEEKIVCLFFCWCGEGLLMVALRFWYPNLCF